MGKGTEYWYQWLYSTAEKLLHAHCRTSVYILQCYCISVATLLQKLLQYYCKYKYYWKPFATPLQKSMQCLCGGKCLCINSEWGDSAICHSPRRWHISTPAASISAPIGGLRFASFRGLFPYLWEVVEQSVYNSPAYMFQWFGRNVHLCLHSCMYIGIAHGVGYVVRFCRTPDINTGAG